MSNSRDTHRTRQVAAPTFAASEQLQALHADEVVQSSLSTGDPGENEDDFKHHSVGYHHLCKKVTY